eukprot:m.139947 g.139947  ORF g.139947 m.139947 type:complete len:112 (-) comp14029_c1_seq2:2957-3292(-)
MANINSSQPKRLLRSNCEESPIQLSCVSKAKRGARQEQYHFLMHMTLNVTHEVPVDFVGTGQCIEHWSPDYVQSDRRDRVDAVQSSQFYIPDLSLVQQSMHVVVNQCALAC